MTEARVMYNVERMVEYGDYGNYARLTPIAANCHHYKNVVTGIVVNYRFTDGRTIELVHNKAEVDVDTFINAGTYTNTYAK